LRKEQHDKEMSVATSSGAVAASMKVLMKTAKAITTTTDVSASTSSSSSAPAVLREVSTAPEDDPYVDDVQLAWECLDHARALYVFCYTVVLPSVRLPPSIAPCLYSLAPHGTSLTIIPPRLNQLINQYSHYLSPYRYESSCTALDLKERRVRTAEVLMALAELKLADGGLEEAVTDLQAALQLREAALNSMDRRVADALFALGEAMRRLADSGLSDPTPCYKSVDLFHSAGLHYSRARDIFIGLNEMTGDGSAFGEVITALGGKESLVRQEEARLGGCGVPIIPPATYDVSAAPLAPTPSSSSSSSQQQQQQESTDAMMVRLQTEGWLFEKGANYFIGQTVRFLDTTEDEDEEEEEEGEKGDRGHVAPVSPLHPSQQQQQQQHHYMWEEGRVLAYLPPDEVEGDPALYKVCFIVDFVQQSVGYHDLEQAEVEAAAVLYQQHEALAQGKMQTKKQKNAAAGKKKGKK
jgi:hypothetical protein